MYKYSYEADNTVIGNGDGEVFLQQNSDSYTIVKGRNKVKPFGMNTSGVSGTIEEFMKILKWLLYT